MKKHLVIFSGYNQRAVIAFLRTLRKNGINEYSIIASSLDDPIFLTDYKDAVYFVREKKELDLSEIIGIFENLIREKSIDQIIIVPSTEALNRFVLEYRERFEHHNVFIPLVNKELYELISDKESFWNYCKDYQLLVPNVVEFPSSFTNPFVAKPKQYFAHDGHVYSPVLILTEKDYVSFRDNYDVNDFTFQAYISGESYYLLYYFKMNGEIIKFSQINYCQQPNGKSILLAAPAKIHEMSISRKYEELLNKMGFHGLIMIELRKRNREYYMIEANPRLWGPSQLFVDAKVPIFESFLLEIGLIEEGKSKFEKKETNIRYCWLEGAGDLNEKNVSCVWHRGGKRDFKTYNDLYLKYDIYHRADTIKLFEKGDVING